MIEVHMEQRSPEWYEVRRGVITASQAHRLLTPAKRKTYALELLAQQLSTEVEPSYTSQAMQWGIDIEPSAKRAYELVTGRTVIDAGFVWRDESHRVGASPDGWVNEGLIEIKCPNTVTHLNYMLDGYPPPEYLAQMQMQMLVTGCPWCDWVSFDPRLVENDLFTKRINRDQKMIDALEVGITETLALIDQFKANITTTGGNQ